MPNIEIHGYGFDFPVQDLKINLGFFYIKSLGPVCLESHAYGIAREIEEAMRKMGLGGDAVITIVPSLTFAADGTKKPMPFIRICDTDKKRMGRILLGLKEANIDIDVEQLLLSGFTDAKDMKA
jgi:hypothetical protein